MYYTYYIDPTVHINTEASSGVTPHQIVLYTLMELYTWQVNLMHLLLCQRCTGLHSDDVSLVR